MYLRVWNKADEVSRLNLQYLGLSTKRDDEETIGQFGSGIKYAPILALRKGVEFVFVGNDQDGPYQLRYIARKLQGIDVVYYDYGYEQIPSSFTVDAGALSWEDEFQIYREVVSNAKDGAGNDKSLWGIDLVDDVYFKEGEFSIFIEATDKIMEVYRNHDYYYCDNAEVYYSCSMNKVDILKPVNTNAAAIYCKSVLVYESDEDYLFHYNGKSFKLNEERKLASPYVVSFDIARALCHMDNKAVINTILDKIIGIEPLDNDNMEFWHFSEAAFEYNRVNDAWGECFNLKYGDKSVLLNSIESAVPNVALKVKELGYSSVHCLSSNLYYILKKSGVRTLSDIANEDLKYDVEYDYENYPNFVRALEIAEHFEKGLKTMHRKIGLFSAESQNLLGLTILVDKPRQERQILINKHHAKSSSVESLIATIIHEYDHYDSGYTDGNTEFRNLADNRIGKLMFEHYKQDLIHTDFGSKDIQVKIKDLPYVQGLDFQVEKSEVLKGCILKIGSKKFLIKSPMLVNNLKGVMSTSNDGSSMVIKNAFLNPVNGDSIQIEEI